MRTVFAVVAFAFMTASALAQSVAPKPPAPMRQAHCRPEKTRRCPVARMCRSHCNRWGQKCRKSLRLQRLNRQRLNRLSRKRRSREKNPSFPK